MNILATYATSYVNAFDVALSARSEQPAGKRDSVAANDRGFRRLFSFGARADTAKAA
ncbi:MAG: hypothetical protein WD034_07980 [Parvibaculum sp.]|uniref:hypothetical protein n=1 Tax=Parvibaculum sp. TaxID=2024848 RepID=UPI0034A06FD9